MWVYEEILIVKTHTAREVLGFQPHDFLQDGQRCLYSGNNQTKQVFPIYIVYIT